MTRILVLLTLAASIFGCSRSLLANDTQTQKTITSENSMSSKTDIAIKSITLMSREEKRPPTGKPPLPNRDIGFASVFLKIENNKEENTKLVIEKIQIQDAITGSVQLVSQTPEEISLKPLENSVNDFHLSNKTGYSTRGQVKAVVTYRIGNQVQVIKSSPIDVDRL